MPYRLGDTPIKNGIKVFPTTHRVLGLALFVKTSCGSVSNFPNGFRKRHGAKGEIRTHGTREGSVV